MRDFFENAAPDNPDGGRAPRRAPDSAQAILRARLDGAGGRSFTPCGSMTSRCARRRAGCSPRRRWRLAQALAAEWEAQRDMIDPAKMPLTRLANSIIDGVERALRSGRRRRSRDISHPILFVTAPARRAASSSVRRSIGIRSSHGRATTLGARFLLAEGVMHVAQPRSRARRRRAPPFRAIRGGSARCIR